MSELGGKSVVLRSLTDADASAFLRASAATAAVGDKLASTFDRMSSYADYLALLDDHEHGRNLPELYVPSSTYFGFIGDDIVGRLMLRHVLNDRLLATGGHIGYVVVPAFRRRGIATAMLRLALPLARARGIERILITCEESNIGSRRVIENNGGVLERIEPRPDTDIMQARYWIAL